MKNSGGQKKSGGSEKFARYRFLVFFAVLFLFIAGGAASFLQLSRIIRTNADQKLFQLLEIERLRLEASVNNEIAVAIKMAGSPLIIRHLKDPGDPALRNYALEEIAAYRRAFKSNYVFWISDRDKKFYSPADERFFSSPGQSDNYSYILDPNNPGDYWYNMTLYETELYNFNINYNDNLKVLNLWINAPVFDENRRPIGMLGTGIELTGFVDMIYRELDPGIELFLFNELEEITGARKSNLVSEKADIRAQFGDSAGLVLSSARSLSEQGVAAVSGGGREIAVGRIPQLDWYMAAFLPINAGLYLTNPMTYVLFSMFVVILLVFFMFYRRYQEGIRLEQLVKERTAELSAMKDNLKAGLFLMDGDFIIQGAYSKPLEQILGSGEIEGKKFLDFLGASLKAKERDTLADYFRMVINRSFDAAMLEEINPLSEFVYHNEADGTEKTLRSSFAVVERVHGVQFILGTLEDITEARKLEKQLAEEQGKREEEMRALFQVIQVEPRVFGDFIEDTEYEFDRINRVLQDGELSAQDAMVEIYQSIHAIKSNALILGLDNFSVKLHDLEDTLKQYRDRPDVSFEDVLHITVMIEAIMKEKDKFRDTVDKIEAFRVSAGGNRRQDRYVLVETLTKACEKAAAAQEKKVKFVVEDIDGIVLETGPRRVIKEVLTQMVRNSVYHGIEHPDEREASGKKREGTISLSIKYKNGMVHIKLSDDGRGLNFNKIREKALNHRLLKKEAAKDKNLLLKLIFSPGFSTADAADMHAGRGIGLNLVRDRIRDLHGSIKLSSGTGRGTTFNIFIPLDLKAARAS